MGSIPISSASGSSVDVLITGSVLVSTVNE